MRLLVTSRPQNALFRRVRFSSPAQTPIRLTQKCTLSVGPHGKPHSGPDASRKSAFCPRRLTQRRILRACRHQRTRSVSPRRLPKTDATLARRSVTLARRGPAWRGERPSSCGGATDPPSLPQLPASRFLRLENTRSCAWNWVALSGRFGLVSGEWPSLQ